MTLELLGTCLDDEYFKESIHSVKHSYNACISRSGRLRTLRTTTSTLAQLVAVCEAGLVNPGKRLLAFQIEKNSVGELKLTSG